MALIYGLADMQSFYASCEVASRPEYAAKRTQWDDGSDPALVVAGDPERRSGIILAATPAAKSKGITTAMRLGEALRLSPNLVVVRPRMRFYLEVSVRIQHLMREMFPLQEQFSVDEGFFAFPYPADLFSDPLDLAREFQDRVWEQFRIRCRVGLAPNKWLAKMANGRAKKVHGGVLWWREEDVPAVLHDLSVFDMWGLKKRAQTLNDEFRCATIGDVSRVPAGRLRQAFATHFTLRFWSSFNEAAVINRGSTRVVGSVPHRSGLTAGTKLADPPFPLAPQFDPQHCRDTPQGLLRRLSRPNTSDARCGLFDVHEQSGPHEMAACIRRFRTPNPSCSARITG